MSRYVSKHAKPEDKPKKKKGFLRRFFGFIGFLILMIVLLAGALIGFLSATEYKPADTEDIAFDGDASGKLAAGQPFRIMTWNIGYGALGDNADFFMDGGTMVKTADEGRVRTNLDGILGIIGEEKADIILLQETDRDSSRSCHVNEYDMLRESLPDYTSGFANNFRVAFLPYPVPPIGKVDSGIATFSSYPVSGAERVQLPIPFTWPVRMANLKRCVLVSRLPVEGTDKELVLFNLHLEAYDDGEGKAAQTKMLAELLEAEAQKGNYVIAGGDFNQRFTNIDQGAYPVYDGMWQPGVVDAASFGNAFTLLMDNSSPTCRSLDRAYAGVEKEGFQFYLIDGFIVSANVRAESVETLDYSFTCSDHNPVRMVFSLE